MCTSSSCSSQFDPNILTSIQPIALFAYTIRNRTVSTHMSEVDHHTWRHLKEPPKEANTNFEWRKWWVCFSQLLEGFPKSYRSSSSTQSLECNDLSKLYPMYILRFAMYTPHSSSYPSSKSSFKTFQTAWNAKFGTCWCSNDKGTWGFYGKCSPNANYFSNR